MVDRFVKTGKLRTTLFITAIIGTIILYIVDPPSFLSSKILILPFPFLLLLTFWEVIFSAIIVAECIRIFAHRLTSAWNLKMHFIIVFTVIIVFAGLKAITFHKTSIGYFTYALSLIEKRDLTHAIASLDIALAYDSQNQMAYSERGYVHRKLGNFQAALVDYNAAIRINPQFVNAYAGRGHVYYSLNDHRKALQDWHQAIAIAPYMSGLLKKWIKAANEK